MSSDENESDASSSQGSTDSSSTTTSSHDTSSNSSTSSSGQSDSSQGPLPSRPERSLVDYIKEATDGFVYPGAQRSGSKPNLHHKTIHRSKVDSDVKHRRYLLTVGQQEIREKRNRRRQTREILQQAGKDTTALESSSEEEADPKDIVDPISRTIDWYEYGRSTSWTNDPIFLAMPMPVIDSALGWAHHQTSDGDHRTNLANGLNPLYDLPNNPLPLTHVEWIAHRAIEGRKNELTCWKKVMFAAQPVDLSHDTPNTNQRLDWQTWEYDSEDETYQSLKMFKPKTTVNVTVPLVTKLKVTENFIVESMCTSAKVALGMTVEEMLTASFLPLARKHVKRCRSLNERDAFHEWTLSPEEAIWKLDAGTTLPDSARDKARPDTFAQWCNARELDAKFVRKNYHLYGKAYPLCQIDSLLNSPTVNEGINKRRRRGHETVK